jgi:hypothetical protein
MNADTSKRQPTARTSHSPQSAMRPPTVTDGSQGIDDYFLGGKEIPW